MKLLWIRYVIHEIKSHAFDLVTDDRSKILAIVSSAIIQCLLQFVILSRNLSQEFYDVVYKLTF